MVKRSSIKDFIFSSKSLILTTFNNSAHIGFAFLTGGYESLRKKLTQIEVSKNVDNCDFIIIGSPVWNNGITPAIRTFIHQNNLSNKKIACFVTLKGNDPGKALDSMKEAILPNISSAELGIINVLKKPEEAEKQIIDWCKKLRA